MKNTFLSVLAAATFASGGVQAATPSAAQTRAALYQREVRAALTANRWLIKEDKAGRLNAERLYIHNQVSGITSNDTTYAHLTIYFQPDSKTHTACHATAARYIRQYPDSPEVDRLMYPPLALRDPKINQEYRDILSAAEQRLGASHPAYATSEKRLLGKEGKDHRVTLN